MSYMLYIKFDILSIGLVSYFLTHSSTSKVLLHFNNVLVLDEVFNEISIEEERKILNNIFNEYKDKIVIMISHRNSNIDLFNKKYKLEGDGRIHEIK